MHYKDEYLPYLNNSRFFYSENNSKNNKEFNINVPREWQKYSDEHWKYCLYLKKKLPLQGWKIHVSCDYKHEQKVLDLVSNYLFSEKISFKFTKNKEEWITKNSKTAPRSSSGKFITIYPKDDDEFVTVIVKLSKILKNYKNAPFILSDKEWQDSCLYYRYGAFQKIEQRKNNKTIYCIYTPDGRKIEDKRVPYYQQPSFVVEPDFIQKNNYMAPGASVEKLKQFQINQSIKFSNAGGIYLGVLNNKKYILKEGRPFAGIDGNYVDGFMRVERESSYLGKLQDVNEVVKIKDYFIAWRHNYLVEEYLAGETLYDYVSDNYPFNNKGDRKLYVDKSISLAKKLIAAVKKIHDHDVAIGDLHPDNIIIQNNNIKILDFEQAHDLKDRYQPGLITPGFGNKKMLNYEQADWYAVYSTIRYLFLPIIDIRGFSSKVELVQNNNLAKYFSKKAANFLKEAKESCDLDYQKDVVIKNSLEEKIQKIEQGILENLDFTTDSIIKGDIDNYIDPQTRFSVGQGAMGLGLLLSRIHLSKAVYFKKQFLNWVSHHRDFISKLCQQRSGLFDGAAGIGSVLL